MCISLKTILVIIISLIIMQLYLIYSVEPTDTMEHYKNEHIKLSSKEREQLILCMDRFSELCDKNNVYYIISFGTLLGSVRHNGFIPWDDDMDLIMYFEDKDKIHNLMLDMQNMYGYKIFHEWKLSRIHINDNIFIDIFYVTNINGTISRCGYETTGLKNKCIMPPDDESGKWWHKDFNFPSEYMGNYDERKLYKFENRYYKGPKYTYELLDHWYGSKQDKHTRLYLTECKTHYLENHTTYVEPKIISCEYEKS